MIALGLRIAATQDHPLRHLLLQVESSPKNSFVELVQSLCQSEGVDLKLVLPKQFAEIPPWLVEINTDFSLTRWKKVRYLNKHLKLLSKNLCRMTTVALFQYTPMAQEPTKGRARV